MINVIGLTGKMNIQERLRAIEKVLDAKEEGLCPYCFGELNSFFHGDEVRSGCDNHFESLWVNDEEYLGQIFNIVKFGDLKKPVKHIPLDKFT